MKKIREYKRHRNVCQTNMRTQHPRTKVVFELDDKEMKLIGDVEIGRNISINTTLTLELNKRLHDNKKLSEMNKVKDKQFRFVVLDTQRGIVIEPRHLDIESNYNTKYEHRERRGVDEHYMFGDRSFEELEVK